MELISQPFPTQKMQKMKELMLKHLYTAFLFTWTDLKTILLPVAIFASACAPFSGFKELVETCIWIWIHLLMCNVSNQARTVEEDTENRPWRPVPSGRLSVAQAVLWRYWTAGFCVLWSAFYGQVVLAASLSLILTTAMYDELGYAGHFITKNICGIFGYVTFELGATAIMSRPSSMDNIAIRAVFFSGLLICTTLQAQDFADVAGDLMIGRKTFPIYAPEFSRKFTLVALVFWSWFSGCFWDLSLYCRVPLIILGSIVGARFYLLRSVEDDKMSYILFNLWLMVVHALPYYARAVPISI
jgi:4-hydroxybenzoate polyprenyltransferase